MGFGGGNSSSHGEVLDPFGRMPHRVAHDLYSSEINPLLTFLGFGDQAGSKKGDKDAARLQGAQGPLADLIRSIPGLTSDIPGQAQDIGNTAAAEGTASYKQLTDQIDKSLGASDLALGYSEQVARDAFSPVANSDLYREAESRFLGGTRQGEAARGMLETGSAQAAESQGVSELALGFAGQQREAQSGAVQGLDQASTVGPGLASAQMQAVPQFVQLLTQKFGIPMEAAGGILQLLTAGQAGGMGLLQATAPMGSSSSNAKNWSAL